MYKCDIASQHEMHLQQTPLLLCHEPYKHPKTTKLNLNTPWMKQNYKNKYTLIIIFSYLPWIILDSWKCNSIVNSYVWFVLMDSQSQFLTSHAIFNHRAYVEQVDWIISSKSLCFSIHAVAFRGTLPMP
jgi:hypothetical protein